MAAQSGDEAAAAAMLRAHLPRQRSANRPEWVHCHGVALDGTRVLHATPARCDPALGSQEAYILDLAPCSMPASTAPPTSA